MHAVMMLPGAIALTRMLWDTHSTAMVRTMMNEASLRCTVGGMIRGGLDPLHRGDANDGSGTVPCDEQGGKLTGNSEEVVKVFTSVIIPLLRFHAENGIE